MLIKEKCSEQRKEIFQIKNDFNIQLIQKTNKQVELMKKFGIYDTEEKLTFKHHNVKESKRHEIVPWESKHYLSLQRSKYLVIENDIERL